METNTNHTIQTNTLSHSLPNMHRITIIVDRLIWHFQQGNKIDSVEFTKLCISLCRGIDFAIANCEIPPKANKLLLLIKQMNHQRKTNDVPSTSLACMMLLCISVKNACKFGWFDKKESEEVLTIADEIGKCIAPWGM
jgi:E3 SUMO-protein ligase PIAS1